MNLQLTITGDGLHSLYVPELDEHYHSTHGALQEALHVFVNAGLLYASAKFNNIKILEVGFGTGLNTLLSAIESNKNNVVVDYHGVEAFPVNNELLLSLNYVEVIGDGETYFTSIHNGEWNKKNVIIQNKFSLTKHHTAILDFKLENEFNLVYFDAFGFRAQEEMWSLEVFQHVYNLMKMGGVLVTYCSKGEVRRRMQQVGFKVEKLAGPKGKREMIRAIK